MSNEEARTIGDMTTEDFFAGMGEAMGTAVSSALTEAGAGRVTETPVVNNPPDADADDPTRGPTPEEQRREERIAYGDGARAWFLFERDAEIRNLPTADAREARINEYLDFHDWAVALTNNDRALAEEIALRSYPKAVARQLTTTGGGAALVPTILEGPIIEKRAVRDKITPLSSQHRSSSGKLDLAVEGVIIVAAGQVEAATGNADTAIDYDPVSLVLKKSTAFVSTSREQVMDSAASMQLVRNISRQAGRAMGTYNNTQNTLGDGTGTNYTDGLLNNASIAEPTGSGGAFSRDTVLALFYDMSEEYTDNLVWLASATVVEFMARYEGANNQPLYPNVNIAAASPVVADGPRPGFGTVEGIQVVQVADFGSILMLANLDFFSTLIDDGIRVETTTTGDGAFRDDLQRWKFVQRQDGAVTLPDAFRKTDAAVTAPV